ncbi:hypothetical protein RAS1_12570 [Phycisphaerae bacterium RAS1]|nr:hypothetical protein RAS1_12570 [Phycisphaerae bacterium RAS1]
MNDLPTMLTPDEIAAWLKLDVSDVLTELNSGRLRGLKMGTQWRVPKHELDAMVSPNVGVGDSHTDAIAGNWAACADFAYIWPNGNREKCTSAAQIDVKLASGTRRFSIGYALRKCFGQPRRRIVVFMGRAPKIVPAVEFVGTNDFADTKHVASVIKGPDNKHIRTASDLPPEYRGFRTCVFGDEIVGPNAFQCIAILAREDERDAMLRHAIIRARYKGWIA